MKKFMAMILLAGVLGLGGMVPSADATSKDKTIQITKVAVGNKIVKAKYAKGKLVGWSDGNTFEVKLANGKHLILRTSNKWYFNNLKEGKTYTYFYKTNKYGQNSTVKINK
ncbi:hypothetical protein [Bacillus sp. 7894-2]|uniref:hypothetical protein n=1 Tax=Bacillus sp. 7894-2 TaxID=2021695 RepID=UPI000BA59801|nr:hypothetical protein [Bacillus sp. 7894-2]PAE25819.1 hypothetical protein CHI10_05930 [Bacillus sp. 7894-2]